MSVGKPSTTLLFVKSGVWVGFVPLAVKLDLDSHLPWFSRK